MLERPWGAMHTLTCCRQTTVKYPPASDVSSRGLCDSTAAAQYERFQWITDYPPFCCSCAPLSNTPPSKCLFTPNMAMKTAFASKLVRLLRIMTSKPRRARPKYALFEQVPLARPSDQKLSLPQSVMRIALDSCTYQRMEDWEVPDVISGNIIWHTIAPLSKDVYVLCAEKHVTALLVVLHDSGSLLVIKAWPAERAGACSPQVDAELEAAKRFAWHPLMGTLVAFAEQDHKGQQHRSFCSITPYSGCSLYAMVNHPDWFKTVSDEERLEFSRLLVTQSLVVYDIMQQTGCGYWYRDVKPDNMCVNPTTGLASIIDYGLMMRADFSDFHMGATFGYHTPEMANPEEDFANFYMAEKVMAATNKTMDVFLTGYVALEVAVGLKNLPWRLSPDEHNTSAKVFETALLQEHADAAAAGYGALIQRVECPVARSFFAEVLCVDPADRPSPAEALRHPWLAESRRAVEHAMAAAAPAHHKQNQFITQLFQGLKGVMLPQQMRHYFSIVDSPVSAASFDFPDSSSTCSSPQACCSHSDSSSCSSHDAAARDQLPGAGAAALHKQRPGLLQRGMKLLAKLSRHSSPSNSRKHSSTAVATTALAVAKAQANVEEESCKVAIPGFCGLRWRCRAGS